MDTPDEQAATAASSLPDDRLRRRPQPEQWIHHVADLNNGEAHTTVLTEPPTSKSRIQRLSRLSSVLDPTIFGGPSFRLTTRTPYQASPEAWVVASIDYFNPRVGTGMQWIPPNDPEKVRFLSCYFSQLPAERSLLSISLEATTIGDAVGHVSLGWVPLDEGWPPVEGLVRFPIQSSVYTEQTLDFTFDRQGMEPPEFVMRLEDGISWMLFDSVTLRTAPLVTFPTKSA